MTDPRSIGMRGIKQVIVRALGTIAEGTRRSAVAPGAAIHPRNASSERGRCCLQSAGRSVLDRPIDREIVRGIDFE